MTRDHARLRVLADQLGALDLAQMERDAQACLAAADTPARNGNAARLLRLIVAARPLAAEVAERRGRQEETVR